MNTLQSLLLGRWLPEYDPLAYGGDCGTILLASVLHGCGQFCSALGPSLQQPTQLQQAS